MNKTHFKKKTNCLLSQKFDLLLSKYSIEEKDRLFFCPLGKIKIKYFFMVVAKQNPQCLFQTSFFHLGEYSATKRKTLALFPIK